MANRQANPDRDKVTKKLQLPVNLQIEIIFLIGFPYVVTHKKIWICHIKEGNVTGANQHLRPTVQTSNLGHVQDQHPRGLCRGSGRGDL